MTYPLKFRQHVLGIQKQEGLSYQQAADRFHIGIASLVRWTKNLNPAPGRDRPDTKIDKQKLIEDINRYPDAYQHERAARLGVSKSGIYHALKRLGVTFKKSPSGIRRLTILPDSPSKGK